MTSWKFLVVEDESDSMELVSGLLDHEGIGSIEAHTGEEALDVLKDTVPTLILIDLALPGIDGWKVLASIKKISSLSSVPRVAMTAYHSAELAHKALEAGFDAYFAKPIDAASFIEDLKVVVRDHK